MTIRKILPVIFVFAGCLSKQMHAQPPGRLSHTLDSQQQSLVIISSLAANGKLVQLKPALAKGLDAGLSVNKIKEALVHLYAYCGFPRSIRGLQTFITVLDERKNMGINDAMGAAAAPITDQQSKYDRGKNILEKLTGTPQQNPQTGYAAFAPTIDTFLKEHLFADIFERNVLTYAERELVTVSVLGSLDAVEPMLQAHLNICLNTGLSPNQLTHFAGILKTTAGEKKAQVAAAVLSQVLKTKAPAAAAAESRGHEEITNETVFAKGSKITNNNFTGNAYLQMLQAPDSLYPASIGNVTFEPGARTKWHIHPGGQILLVTNGTGYYQEKGQPKKIIRKGDVITCTPNIAHWHGASADSYVAHVALTNSKQGEVIWLHPVTNDEYAP